MKEADTFTENSGYIAAASRADFDKWTTYDAKTVSSYYSKRPLLLARRLVQIGGIFGIWFANKWVDAKLGREEQLFKQRAAELRAALAKLGPAFVKIAQAVSSRPDVVPPAYLAELSLLQDRIAPFSTVLALEIIEEELGLPTEQIFSEISPQPVAAASLGQVYQARLRANGAMVAVKVQRPGVKAAIALDIVILRILAGFLRKVGKLNTDLKAVVDEWATSLFREMDYVAEAKNGIKFGKLFGSLPDVLVPSMYLGLTTPRVLIMEWVEGQRLSEVSDLGLVEVGVYCSLSQLLDSGFYHADPHPGNLLRTPDGKLAYLDFGMMGEIQSDVREALIRASVHLVNREFDPLAEDFVTLGLLPKGQQMDDVASALTGIFQKAISSGVRNLSFGNLGAELGQTMYRFKFRIPAYFSLVVRSLTVLEGIALKSDPNYKVLASSYPWIARKVLTDDSPQLRSTLQDLLYKDGLFRIDRLESLLSESTRPMFGASNQQQPQEESEQQAEETQRSLAKRVLRFSLSPEGSFIRDTVLDEVAKGLDALNRVAMDSAAESLTRSLPLFLSPSLSSFAEEEDLEHLANLKRLLALVARSKLASQSEDEEEEEWTDRISLDDIRSGLQQVAEAARNLPSLDAVRELPLSAQQQALLLPADLASRVASRAVARTIRSSVPLRMNSVGVS